MAVDLWVALIALGGTALGTFGGIIAANRLTNYRIECLEKKVDKHNNVIERTYKIEGDFKALSDMCCEKFKVVNHRVDDLEKG